MISDSSRGRGSYGTHITAVVLKPSLLPPTPSDTHWPTVPTLLVPLGTYLRLVGSDKRKDIEERDGAKTLGRSSWFKLFKLCVWINGSVILLSPKSELPLGLRVMLGCVEAESSCISSNPGSATYPPYVLGHMNLAPPCLSLLIHTMDITELLLRMNKAASC